MKIGIVSPYDYCFPGGVVLHISYLAHYFMKMGHQVKIIAPCSRHGVSYFGEEVIAIGRPFPIPNSGSMARIPISPWLGSQIRVALDIEKFDVLHIHEPYTPMLAYLALRYSYCTNIGTFHAFHTKARGYWLGKPILLRASKRLSRKIAVSPAALKFVSRHLPADYTIIPNGVDTELFRSDTPPRAELRNDGWQNVLFVGRLEKRKGVHYLLEAWKEIKSQAPRARLIVVGPGTLLRAEYEKKVEAEGLEDIHFAGMVSSRDLPGYYRAADVFCSPATHGESFGIVLLEAMASGVPVIASDIEGYNNVLCSGQEGLLVPPRDPQALAKSLGMLLKDDDMRHRFAEAGVAKAQAFSWANITRRVMDCYTEAMKENR